MTTSEQLDLLAALAERSPDGLAVPEDDVRGLGGPDFDDQIAALDSEGLIERSAGPSDMTDTITITPEGYRVLEPHNSL